MLESRIPAGVKSPPISMETKETEKVTGGNHEESILLENLAEK